MLDIQKAKKLKNLARRTIRIIELMEEGMSDKDIYHSLFTSKLHAERNLIYHYRKILEVSE